MKSTGKLILVVCLFSSVAFADDGDMGSGGKTCTTNCFVATQPTEEDVKQTKSDSSILTSAQEYLDSLIKYFES
jgi:hypothetical protein